jgi:hypothetical protein
MSVTQNSIELPVKPLPFETIDTAQTGQDIARPDYFAYYKQNIRLYPIPDAVYTMTMAYVYKLTALSSGSDSNAWTTDAEELIRCRAKADLYGHLQRETRLRRSNNMLRVDDALVMPSAYDINYQ